MYEEIELFKKNYSKKILQDFLFDYFFYTL